MQTELCLLLLMPLGMVAQPAPVASATASPLISGAVNFRDIGGMITQDQRTVRRGLIYRSGELSHLTHQDYDNLATIHVRFIYDLRTDGERTAAPTVWTGTQPRIVAMSVGFTPSAKPAEMTQEMFAGGTDPVHVGQAMQAITVKIALDGAPQIGDVLRALARGDEPAIIHCTAGKDRTGVVTAVLLRLIGVPMDAIYDDYVRSNESVPLQLARMKSMAASTGVPPQVAQLPPDTIKVLMGVDRTYLESAFREIDLRYGSFDGYVRDGLGLTTNDVKALRDRLLVPTGGGAR